MFIRKNLEVIEEITKEGKGARIKFVTLFQKKNSFDAHGIIHNVKLIGDAPSFSEQKIKEPTRRSEYALAHKENISDASNFLEKFDKRIQRSKIHRSILIWARYGAIATATDIFGRNIFNQGSIHHTLIETITGAAILILTPIAAVKWSSNTIEKENLAWNIFMQKSGFREGDVASEHQLKKMGSRSFKKAIESYREVGAKAQKSIEKEYKRQKETYELRKNIFTQV